MPTADTYARFYIHPVLREGKRDTPTAVFEDVIHIEIFIKGSQNTTFSRIKEDKDEVTYEAEWNGYINNTDYTKNGVNLNELPGIGPSAQMNLNSQGINTVEDLANLSDGVVIGQRGMLDLRKQANAYLEALNPQIAKEREIKENAQQATIEELQRQVKALQTKRTTRKRTTKKAEAA